MRDFPAPMRGLIPAHAGKTQRISASLHGPGAHPRSRGENPRTLRSSSTAKGSSPLTRGKLSAVVAVTIGLGLIPAHAGKTQARCAAGWKQRAHPRSRGENPVTGQTRRSSRGSSPLTRGKREVGASRRDGSGLIPAHAGKTDTSPRARGPLWAHPRSRGENRSPRRSRHRPRGSSPLTRGKPVLTVLMNFIRGLIPAHAGKTSTPTGPISSPRAHPRSRGENSTSAEI